MIALHGTDPASVYLAAWARSADGHRAIGHAAVERALYQDGELLRMLGMRRTMFVVPAGLAPVIQAACTDQVAERMRKGLVRDLATAGVAGDAGRWLDEVGDATVKALTARGAATGAELARDEPRLRTQLIYAEGKNYGGSTSITSRVLMLLSAERRTARVAAGPPASTSGCRPIPGRPVPRRTPGPNWPAAGCWHSARHRSPTCSGGPAGRPARHGRRSASSR